MNRVVLGLIAGIVFGLASVASMIPLSLPDRKRAMLGAFLNRFAIGFLVAVTDLPVAPWVRGGCVGLLISLPAAVITKSYAAILGSGVIGGALIGFLVR